MHPLKRPHLLVEKCHRLLLKVGDPVLLSTVDYCTFGEESARQSFESAWESMGDPDSENGDGGLLKYAKLVDSERFGVWGVALVMNGFKASLHFHPEDETYYFLWGEGFDSVMN